MSAGSLTSPYYQFYTDSAGTQEIDPPTLYLDKTYTFYRLNNATTFPFYLSDNGQLEEPSSYIELSGDGDSITGIVGTQSFSLTFTGLTTSGVLEYFCTTRDVMVSDFILEETSP